MAEKINIDIAGQMIEVPKWSTEETLSELVKIDKAALNALTAMLKDNKAFSNKAIRENEKILAGVKTSLDTSSKSSNQKDEKIIKKLSDLFNADKLKQTVAKKQRDAQENLLEDLKDQAKQFNKNIGKVGKDLASGINKSDFGGIATALGSVIGLGTAAGFAAGIFEGFAKNLSNLANVGVGVSTSLVDLRGDAANAGLDLQNYGKIIQGNMSAIRALGDSTDDGARRFSQLSNQLRNNAREFGQFGLTNTEYNEILAEEIDLRRRQGMNEAQITNAVSSSMNNLLQETTAMAAATGQDRREMLRSRQELLSDPVIESANQIFESMGKQLPDTIGNLGAVISGLGDEGKVFAGALAQSAVTGMDFFNTEFGRSMAEMISVGGPEVQSAFRNITDFVSANYDSMPADEFNNKIIAMMGGLDESMSVDARQNLMKLAAVGDDGAKRLLTFLNGLNGIADSEEKVADARKKTEEGLKENEPFLALSGAIESATNAIKAAAVDEVFSNFGDDLKSGGQGVVDALRGIEDNLKGKSLSDAFGFDITTLVVALGVLTAAVTGLTAVMVGRGVMGLGRGAARGGRGLFNRLRGGQTTPRTTTPRTTAPGTSAPRTTAPGTTAPGATAPKPTAPPATTTPSSSPRSRFKMPSMPSGGNIAKLAGRAAKFIPGVGLVAAGGMGIYDGVRGFTADEDAGFLESTGNALSSIASGLTFGLLGSSPEEISAEAANNTNTDTTEPPVETSTRSGLPSVKYMGQEFTSARQIDKSNIKSSMKRKLKKKLAMEQKKNAPSPTDPGNRSGADLTKTRAVQHGTILKNMQKLEADAASKKSELDSFVSETGPLEKIGYDDVFEEDIMGYKDPELQKQFSEKRGASLKAEGKVRKLGGNLKYKYARAIELAKAMGIETPGGKVKFGTTGNAVTSINGQQVPQELLTDRERSNVGAAEKLRDAMNNRPSPITGGETDTSGSTTTSTTTTTQQDTEKPLTREQGDAIIKELKENNRLQKKNNDTVELNGT